MSHSEEVLVQGHTASIGLHSHVSGRVTVVTQPKDIQKLHKGDIIVLLDIGSARAHFDQKFPEKVPEIIRNIFENASAVILERGGVQYPICISAREKRLLMIVKAKSATKKLKDGMYVEINARTGEIRKASVP